jgi:hypothetical protein
MFDKDRWVLKKMNSLFFKKSLFTKAIITLLVMTSTAVLGTSFAQKASASTSVCGLTREYAFFKTKNYLITICVGEASFQMIKLFHDGTGYQRIPVQKEGNKFIGSDDKHNYILDSRQLLIGTDGEPPVIERVIQRK